MKKYLDEYQNLLKEIIKIQESIIYNIKLNIEFDLNSILEKRQQLVTTLLSIPLTQEEKSSFNSLKERIVKLENTLIEETKKTLQKLTEEQELHIRNKNKMIRYFKTLLQNVESALFDSKS
ncbi:hypothetical protein JXR93_07400 [bacterium]|nr:hypothetical protein [bacterium]